jgi:putative nucleotidyltransferase with HDIG domain
VLASFEIAYGAEAMSPSRSDLVIHSLAVACCAERIAQLMPVRVDPQLAYLAGLLHDIGKLALQELIPKSFTQIVARADSAGQSICIAEQESLQIDHTVIGKGLAQRWRLPEEICLAIWLHHSDTAAIARDMPEARIAQVVQAADYTARHGAIGRSGSFDQPPPITDIADSLGVGLEQLEQIRGQLPEAVKKKAEALRLDMPNAASKYCDLVQAVAVEFARRQTQASAENRNLQVGLNHLDWIRDFLLGTARQSRAIEIAESFAVRWQRFYQTGSVCLYIIPAYSQQVVEAVVVEALGQTKKVILNAPEGSSPIPDGIADRFSVLDALGRIDWCVEQLEVDFDLNRTKLVPLTSNGLIVAIIAFELHYPGDVALLTDKFQASALVGGAVLAIALGRQQQERFAERFVQLVSRPKDIAQPKVSDSPMEALAEMAAGVAHELNNPLSVISGRAQLLADGESDERKKQELQQIQDNAREASGIIDELMSFAQPEKPRLTHVDVGQILDEAVQLAGQKTGVEHIDVQMEIAKAVKELFVDSAQIVSAIANVISNAVESYTGKPGPIKITAEAGFGGGVKIRIGDLGCGMDSQAVRKATYPFFSARPAGRKRGMGLAHATRLVRLNGGSLHIESEPGKGTTVTINFVSTTR